MCVACVGAATPEVVVAIGGYAAIRFGRPLERLRALRTSGAETGEDSVDEAVRPA